MEYIYLAAGEREERPVVAFPNICVISYYLVIVPRSAEYSVQCIPIECFSSVVYNICAHIYSYEAFTPLHLALQIRGRNEAPTP